MLSSLVHMLAYLVRMLASLVRVSATPASTATGESAYEALRVAVFPWLRERRLRKKERLEKARLLAKVISAGDSHSLALRSDGSVACWGLNDDGEAPPAGVHGPFKTPEV